MRKIARILKNEAGFTLMEAMIAAALVMIVAVAMLPSFTSLRESGKLATFKIQCNSMVKAKLQEYVSGSGLLTAATAGFVPTGFQYTKYRYQNITGSCTAAPTVGAPGFRENLQGNTKMNATDATEIALTAGGANGGAGDLLGFQLWVNLRRYNPRTNPVTRDCPSPSINPNSASLAYQFLRVGDGIEITVTGMIRTAPTRANGGRGGIPYAGGSGVHGIQDLDANTPNKQLTCSASQIVYPKRPLFRYYMGNDGRIRNNQGSEASNAGNATQATPEAVESHFRTIWSQQPTTGNLASGSIANIRGFSVSPDNNTVYILKPGVLARYSGCTDYIVSVGAYSFNGVPDCRNAPTEWSADVNTTVDAITVDFGDVSTSADDVIYGLKDSGPNIGASGAELLKFNLTTFAFETNATYTLPTIPRIRSIFLVPTFPLTTKPTLYVADNSCYLGPTGVDASAIFCVTLYNSENTTLNQVASDLPVQAESFSN